MTDNKCTHCGFECNDLLGKRCPCCLWEPKTEDLNFMEACAAIGRGECVGFEKKLFNSDKLEKIIVGPQGVWQAAMKVWNNRVIDFKSMIPVFRIVPDPSKQVEPQPSLTYEQALECEKVRIHNNPETKYPLVYEKEFGSWDIFTKIVFDLAERRGYRMEKVE